MTLPGIEMCKAGLGQLLAAVRRMLGPALHDDPMMSALVDGLERSLPQVCDLAVIGLAARSKPPRAPLAVTAMTVGDLAAWLAENPKELLVTISRPLAEAITTKIKEEMH
jgi:hypothetical protein